MEILVVFAQFANTLQVFCADSSTYFLLCSVQSAF